MPILLTEQEQCELRAGSNSLGGNGPDSILLSRLSEYPLVGTIVVGPDATPMIRRLSSRIALMVNGVMLGAAPAPLSERAVIQVGTVRMTLYADTEAAEAAAPGVPRRRRESELATRMMAAIAAPVRPAALIPLDGGGTIRLPGRDVVIGRSEQADVVLAREGVSRRHAVLCAEGGGYSVADESTNGTFVNGERVTGRTSLNAGDTIAFGAAQYRFDFIDAALAARLGDGAAGAADGIAAAPTALAELEVVRGRGSRKAYAVERPVCVLGRGAHNDVSIDDVSVSASHATLLLKGDTWFLTDLRSANGTFVDGYRVAGERALAAGSVIRIGEVALAFRPTGAGALDDGTRARGGMLRRIGRALRLVA